MEPPGPSARKACAFTLVEMLVVMAVIVALTSIVAPAVVGLGKASGLSGAGNEVESLFTKARQNSVSKDVLTAVVVLGDPSANGSAFRVMTLLQLTPRSDGQPFTTTDWQQVEPWHVLTTGVIVDNQPPATGSGDSSFLAPVSFQPAPPSLRYQASTIQPVSDVNATGYYYQIFLPSGKLYQQSSPCSLKLVSGYYTGTTPVYTSKQADFYTVLCTDATGDIKILRP